MLKCKKDYLSCKHMTILIDTLIDDRTLLCVNNSIYKCKCSAFAFMYQMPVELYRLRFQSLFFFYFRIFEKRTYALSVTPTPSRLYLDLADTSLVGELFICVYSLSVAQGRILSVITEKQTEYKSQEMELEIQGGVVL